MEYIFSRDLRLKLADGVEAPKFDANRVIATIPKNVLSLFLEYGEKEDNGATTTSAKQIELENILVRIKPISLFQKA